MPDRIVKPDTGNDLVIQNDDASAKIEVNEDGTIVATPSVQVDNIKIDGNTIVSTDTNGNVDLTPNGTGEVNISKVDIDAGTIDGTTIANSDVTVGAGKTLDVSAGTFTSSTAQKEVIVQAGPGSGTLDVSSGTFTTSSAQKQAIVQAGPGSGTLDVSSGTFTTSSAQKEAIVSGGLANGQLIKSEFFKYTGGDFSTSSETIKAVRDYQSFSCTVGSTIFFTFSFQAETLGNGQNLSTRRGACMVYQSTSAVSANATSSLGTELQRNTIGRNMPAVSSASCDFAITASISGVFVATNTTHFLGISAQSLNDSTTTLKVKQNDPRFLILSIYEFKGDVLT